MLPIKKQKLKDVRSFVPSWTIDYGFEKYGDKSRCGLCSEIIVSRTSSIKRHFESKHKDVAERNIDEKKELISQRLKMTENQSNLLSKFVKTNNNVTEASFKISNLIAKRSKPFSDGEYIKTIMLQAAPGLFEDFNNKEKIIQRIKELQLSRNTVKDRILKISTNISEQLQNDINKCDYISIYIAFSVIGHKNILKSIGTRKKNFGTLIKPYLPSLVYIILILVSFHIIFLF